MRLLLIAALLVVTPAVAQKPPPAPAGPQAPRPGQSPYGVGVDSVIATINDSSILRSEVETAAAGELRSKVDQGARLTREDVEIAYNRQLDNLIHKYQLAQSAKTLGLATPEQVEAWISSEIERGKQGQIRDLGSSTELGRALKDQGRTWQTVEREQRVEVMYDIARSLTIGARLQQANLITPRMMREAFEQMKGYFQHPALARVTMLAFTGPDAAANAALAAKEWAISPFSSRELAAKIQGARAYPELIASELGEEYATIRQFALDGPDQRVSGPIDLKGSIFVAKITQFEAVSNGQFEDAAVQERLRLFLDKVLADEFLRDAQARASARTEVWVSGQLRSNPATPPARR